MGGFPCCHCSELSSICDFARVVTALFQKSVGAIFLLLSRHNLEAVDRFRYVVTAVSLNSLCDFPHVVTALSQKAVDLVFCLFSLHT